MIGIISQNNILKDAMIEILNEFSAESYQEHHEYQLIILLKDFGVVATNPLPSK